MATRIGRSALVSVIAAFVMLAPLGTAQAQGKSGAHLAATDGQSPTVKNLSARGSIAKVTGNVRQVRNLSARGSLAQVPVATAQSGIEGTPLVNAQGQLAAK